MSISFAMRFVELPSFLIVFAPRPFTLSVADAVFARFALNENFCPVAYAVGACERVISKAFTAQVATACTHD